VCAPCEGIVPYAGFCDPKPRFPLVETTVDDNALLPNSPNKENRREPTGVVLEEGP
jgi:hypothetical protein